MSFLKLPKVPMAPITTKGHTYHSRMGPPAKMGWVRSIVRLDGQGGVEIYSKKVELKNSRYPEIIEVLKQLRWRDCIFRWDKTGLFTGIRKR